eukprot:2163307-Prymnesium_polylepis.1
MSRILTTQSRIFNPARGAVGPAPPRGIPVPRYVCGLCVLRGYGLRDDDEQGTRTGPLNSARVRRRERHDRATHDR